MFMTADGLRHLDSNEVRHVLDGMTLAQLLEARDRCRCVCSDCVAMQVYVRRLVYSGLRTRRKSP